MLNPLFEDLEFEVNEEAWNEYELEDGNYRLTLRMRSILLKVLKPKIMKNNVLPPTGVPINALPVEPPKNELQMTFQNIVVVSNCPMELMGKPTQVDTSQVNLAQSEIEDINFVTFKDPWNLYTISPPSGMKFKTKVVVSLVSKIKNAYDQFGYPMYMVQSTNIIVPISPKNKK